MEEAGVEHTPYQMHEMYPTHEIFTIVNRLAQLTDQSDFTLQVQYGEFIVPDLMLVYGKYIQPE
nr:heme NO-binding domain-containing protein [Pontibacter pudoricolor]